MISACIIAIGDELLNGFTVDTNTQWLKEEFSKSDVRVLKSTIVPDIESSILDELEKALEDKTGLKVSISNKKDNSGKIYFEYKDLEQLEFIAKLIKTNN